MKIARSKASLVVSIVVLFSSVFSLVYTEYAAQKCVTDTMMAQIGSLDNPSMDATVPPLMMEVVDHCVSGHTFLRALSLGLSSIAAAVLGAILSNQLSARPSINVYAHYEPDASKLVLRFDRPVIAQNPQRVVLLYRHADGMAAAVPGRQCGDAGLTLAFTTNVDEPPTHMELVVCSGAMHPAGFPESDVCTGGRPIHVDVDILRCDS